MMKFVQARLPGNVGEYDGGIVHEAARRDGPMLGIFHGLVNAPGGDSHLI